MKKYSKLIIVVTILNLVNGLRVHDASIAKSTPTTTPLSSLSVESIPILSSNPIYQSAASLSNPGYYTSNKISSSIQPNQPNQTENCGGQLPQQFLIEQMIKFSVIIILIVACAYGLKIEDLSKAQQDIKISQTLKNKNRTQLTGNLKTPNQSITLRECCFQLENCCIQYRNSCQIQDGKCKISCKAIYYSCQFTCCEKKEIQKLKKSTKSMNNTMFFERMIINFSQYCNSIMKQIKSKINLPETKKNCKKCIKMEKKEIKK